MTLSERDLDFLTGFAGDLAQYVLEHHPDVAEKCGVVISTPAPADTSTPS